MPENIYFGKPMLMTREEIAQTYKVTSSDVDFDVKICENSGFHAPMRTLFADIAPPGTNVKQEGSLAEMLKQQKYAKAVRALAKLQGDFSALKQGARARVFVNHTGSLPNTVFFERSGVASAASVGSDGTLTVFKLFNHIDIKSPELVKELTISARYIRRFAA